jgi:hypothetical protein
MSITVNNPDEYSIDSSVAALLDGLEAGDAAAGLPPLSESEGPDSPSLNPHHAHEAPDRGPDLCGSQGSIESLDAALAGLAANMFGHEAVTEPDPEPYVPPMPAVAVLKPDIYRAPPSTPCDEPASEPDPDPASSEPEVQEEIESPQHPAGPSAVEQFVTQAKEQAATALHRVLLALAAPLAPRPPIARTAVGIAAGFHLVLASVVWFCVVFVQPDVAPPPRPVAQKAPAKASAAKSPDQPKSTKAAKGSGKKAGAAGGH